MESRAHLYTYATKQELEGLKIDEVFTKIHDTNAWLVKSPESVSGEGSTLEQTKVLAAALPSLFKRLQIKTLLDIPCGDFNWMQHVDLEGIQYLGADIVEALVIKNRENFSNKNRNFRHLNLLSDRLPACDLIFCRDCLVHLSFDDIRMALTNIKRSPARYIALTHFPEEAVNTDVPTGGWRPLNFLKAPFNLPEPVAILNEHCTEMGGIFADKSIAVWRLNEI